MLFLVKKLWNSPTFTTWASMGTQSVSLLAVLPLVLTRLNDQEIAVFFLFAAVIGLQSIFQIGFPPTFIRLIGYAYGGRTVGEMRDLRNGVGREVTKGVNLESLCAVVGTMRMICRWLGAGTFLVLGVIGTIAMIRPLDRLEAPLGAWIGWAAIVLVSSARVWCSGYSSFLKGANHVALINRWQALFNIFGMVSKVLVLTIFPSLMLVILVNQIWVLMNTVREWQLTKWVSQGRFSEWARTRSEMATAKLAWASSWRSGVGILGSRVTQQSLGIIFAQYGTAPFVASYLLGMRLIKVVESFAMAPFYSKIPLMNRLRSQGENDRLMRVAVRGAKVSHAVYFFGFAGLALSGPSLMELIGANVDFPRPALWYILGVAFFFQRFGGNHIQLYSTTNHIIWHWANGLQGVVIVIASVMLAPRFGDLGFAGAILAGNFVYAVYTAVYSYRILEGGAFRFELKSSLAPCLGLCLLAFFEWQLGLSAWISNLLATWAGAVSVAHGTSGLVK